MARDESLAQAEPHYPVHVIALWSPGAEKEGRPLLSPRAGRQIRKRSDNADSERRNNGAQHEPDSSAMAWRR